MKTRFDQWLYQINEFKSKEAALERVTLVKLSRRIQKIYFAKYRERTREATWNLNSLKKSQDYNGFIRHNAAKRMFLGLLRFVRNFIAAKKSLNRAIIQKDYRTKKDFFIIWFK
jgi:hypothetical protein